MFRIIGKRKRELNQAYTLISRLTFEMEDLKKSAQEYYFVVLEDILIGYCRIYGKRIKIDGPKNLVNEYLENAILFCEPFILEHHPKLIGICYNPKFDIDSAGAQSALLKGRHLGLEGIFTTSYLAGDEADYQPWNEIGEAVLEILKKQFDDFYFYEYC